MEHSKRPRPLDIIYPARKTLWILGFYTSKDMKKHPLHQVNRFIVTFVLLLIPILTFTELVIDQGNIVYLEVLHYFLVHIFIIIKLSLYLNRRSKLTNLENLLQSKDLNMHTRNQDHFISNAIKIQQIFAGSLGVMGWVFTLIFAVLPLVTEQSLLVPIWMPINLGTGFWHAFEILYYFFLVCIYTSINSIVIGCVAIATAQFEILRHNLENVVIRRKSESYAVQEKRIEKRLIGCVIHHNAIIQFVKRVEEMFSSLIFYQVLFSILGICLTAIQFTLVQINSIKFASECVYLIGMLFQIFSPCWFAQDIILQSSGVVLSCFMSDWYTCCPSNRKIFFVIMERAKKPIVLRAGPFLTLSLNTFVMILSKGYSYYAVLSNLYQK